jgi:hypothetical protein
MAGIMPPSFLTLEGPMPEQSEERKIDLVGAWRKKDAPACAEKYPDLLAFSTGTYRGTRGDTQGFIWWDAGIYRVEDGRRLLLSVANDALVAYEIHLDGDVLAVVDPEGCRFSYQRARPPG